MEGSIDRQIERGNSGPQGRVVSSPVGGVLDRLAQRLLLSRLARIARGRLVIEERGERHVFGTARNGTPGATVTVNDPRCYVDIAFGGSVGAGEAYAKGLWDCDDLTAAMRVLLLNRDALDSLEGGPAFLATPMARLVHWLNRNTRAGSRRNIAAHYDLGNEFFALWLDPSMMYSAAIYDRPPMSLDEAAWRSWAHACRRSKPAPRRRTGPQSSAHSCASPARGRSPGWPAACRHRPTGYRPAP